MSFPSPYIVYQLSDNIHVHYAFSAVNFSPPKSDEIDRIIYCPATSSERTHYRRLLALDVTIPQTRERATISQAKERDHLFQALDFDQCPDPEQPLIPRTRMEKESIKPTYRDFFMAIAFLANARSKDKRLQVYSCYCIIMPNIDTYLI